MEEKHNHITFWAAGVCACQKCFHFFVFLKNILHGLLGFLLTEVKELRTDLSAYWSCMRLIFDVTFFCAFFFLSFPLCFCLEVISSSFSPRFPLGHVHQIRHWDFQGNRNSFILCDINSKQSFCSCHDDKHKNLFFGGVNEVIVQLMFSLFALLFYSH